MVVELMEGDGKRQGLYHSQTPFPQGGGEGGEGEEDERRGRGRRRGGGGEEGKEERGGGEREREGDERRGRGRWSSTEMRLIEVGKGCVWLLGVELMERYCCQLAQ